MRKALSLILVAGALLCVVRAHAAEATTYQLTSLTSTGTMADINVSTALRKDAVMATVQVEATGSPATCTVKVLGRLRGLTGYVQIGEDLDCTASTGLSFYGLAWDWVKVELTALTGGSTPEVIGAMRAVSQ